MNVHVGGTPLQAASRAGGGDMRVGEIFGVRLLQDATRSPWEPPLDIYELEDEFVVLVEIPGLSRRSLDVSFDCEDNVLIVSGWRDDLSPPGRVCTHQMEIRHGNFECRIKMLVPVVVDRIDAKYAKGFIKIALPKEKV